MQLNDDTYHRPVPKNTEDLFFLIIPLKDLTSPISYSINEM